MFHSSEKLAKQSNMKYTHITLDCGGDNEGVSRIVEQSRSVTLCKHFLVSWDPTFRDQDLKMLSSNLVFVSQVG